PRAMALGPGRAVQGRPTLRRGPEPRSDRRAHRRGDRGRGRQVARRAPRALAGEPRCPEVEFKRENAETGRARTGPPAPAHERRRRQMKRKLSIALALTAMAAAL